MARWAENTEHAFYRSVLPDIDIGRFPHRATAASYHRALMAGDEYTVGLEVEHVGNSSITTTGTPCGRMPWEDPAEEERRRMTAIAESVDATNTDSVVLVLLLLRRAGRRKQGRTGGPRSPAPSATRRARRPSIPGEGLFHAV